MTAQNPLETNPHDALYREAARNWLILKKEIDSLNTNGGKKKLPKRCKTVADLRTPDQKSVIAQSKAEADALIPEGMSALEAQGLIVQEMVKLQDEEHNDRIVRQREESGITPLSMEAL